VGGRCDDKLVEKELNSDRCRARSPCKKPPPIDATAELGIGADGAKAPSRNETAGGPNEASATTAPRRRSIPVFDRPFAERCALIGLLALTLAAAAEAPRNCDEKAAVVEPCREVHGRLQASNGNPGIRIWVVGTKRYLGVAGGEGTEWLPESLRRRVTFDTLIYGDFLVCPISASKAGEMQLVCVESGRRLVQEEFLADGQRRVRRIPDVESWQ
jgi:hypothetical protein